MSELVKELSEELKQTMGEMLEMFQQELGEKNEQLARMEKALCAQQQLTIQANERFQQLELTDRKRSNKNRHTLEKDSAPSKRQHRE